MILALLLASIPAANPPQPTTGSDIDSLVSAERAFDRASAERGVREAFLEFLAGGSIVFRPGPVDGRQWFTDRPDLPGKLSWQPNFAEIAAAGDLGYTSGPWTFQGNPPEPPESPESPESPVSDDEGVTVKAPPEQYGHYVSIWRFEEDGVWRVILDLGITHGPGPAAPMQLHPAGPEREEQQPVAVIRRSMLEADIAVSTAASKVGMAGALAEAADDDVRVYRNGTPPRVGPEALRTAEAASPVESWQPAGGAVARSKDLGYTYGTTYRQEGNRGLPSRTYTRIWRRAADGTWRIALDIIVPLPEPAPILDPGDGPGGDPGGDR